MPATLTGLLRRAAEQDGSDLHLTAGTPPRIRVRGDLCPQDDLSSLSPDDVKRLIYSGLTQAQRQVFETTSELDYAFGGGSGAEGGPRVRANVYRQRGHAAGVYRLIPDRIPDFAMLGLPSAVVDLSDRPHGLVLVTGPTGSGKTSTLAAMIDRINRTRPAHVLTIEDPIEYVHPHRRSVVNQREVHADTASFASALRAALREDPDVVLIGEMRDLETSEAALRLAETGHLTLATLHTSSAVQAVSRIIDLYPAHRQNLVRTQLCQVLEGVVCQRLVPAADGGVRVCAAEVLIATPAIRNLIREDRLHQAYSTMQAAGASVGMQTMTQALASHCHRGAITRKTALTQAPNRNELIALLDRALDRGRGRGHQQ
ncbi:MAG: type IV pilus twitching motility protein PilT [Acidobacteria bacterium]|nr:type IV pilus twitching motility protein PilT [Acidobacteriota bacterium]